MGNRLPYELEGRGHWINMLGGARDRSMRVEFASRIRHSLNGGYITIHFHLRCCSFLLPSRYLLR
jgi:hypothetical protein